MKIRESRKGHFSDQLGKKPRPSQLIIFVFTCALQVPQNIIRFFLISFFSLLTFNFFIVSKYLMMLD
jgi:hypothetical protein